MTLSDENIATLIRDYYSIVLVMPKAEHTNDVVQVSFCA